MYGTTPPIHFIFRYLENTGGVHRPPWKGGRRTPSVSSRFDSKLPLPLYANVRLHIPMTHHIPQRYTISPGSPAFEIVLSYASKTGCSTGKIVLDIEHESGFSARWGVRMLDESPSAFDKREWSWKIDTRVVPTAANSEASESNYSEWLSCDGSTTDPTLCWPAGNYTAKVVIYNGDISPPHPYATASTVFRLKESFERPFEASAPSSVMPPCYVRTGIIIPPAFFDLRALAWVAVPLSRPSRSSRVRVQPHQWSPLGSAASFTSIVC